CQRSSVLAWTRTRGPALPTPCSPVIGWQDTRARTGVEALAPRATDIRRASGLVLSAHYGAGKLHQLWRAQAANAHLRLGPLAAFLVEALTGTAAVDHANAQRTQLLGLERLDWEPFLLEAFRLPGTMLPPVRPILHDYGRIRDTDMTLRAVSGDQNAAWFSHGPPTEGTARVNLGSGGFVLAALPHGQAPPELLQTLALSAPGETAWLLEATLNGAGSAFEWLREHQGVEHAETRLDHALATVTQPPLFINTVGGLGSPWWTTGLAPQFSEIRNPPEPLEQIAAVGESILFLVVANLERMRRHVDIRRLHISGGLAQSDTLCQRLADLSGLPTERLTDTEASARGIAWLAAGRPTTWATHGGRRFDPRRDPSLEERYRRSLARLDALAGHGPTAKT
ncbi:MAG TPA: hypothetical protein ENJ05_10075, partial [Thiotrichales bacterium]|nr:hypothetical protein [Thiotrichales bacterium]